MNATLDITTDTTAEHIIPRAAGWPAAEAAHKQAGLLWMAASSARIIAGSRALRRFPDHPGWPHIAALPDVAPLVEREDEARVAYNAATDALFATPAPDWRAWAYKFNVAREHLDDLLGPLCGDAWRSLRKHGAKGWPGSFEAFQAMHFALASHTGLIGDAKRIGQIPALVEKCIAKAGTNPGMDACLVDARCLSRGEPRHPDAHDAAPHPDAELLALGAEFERRWEAQRALPSEAFDAEYDALQNRTSEIGDQIRRVRATTLDGLRVKARVAQECQTDTLSEPFEISTGDYLSDNSVAESIVNDLLGLPPREAPERDAEARAEYEAVSRLRGMRAPCDMNSPAARAWYAARDRYFAAQAASDAWTSEKDAADPEGSDAALDTVAEAMERWESLPPPSLESLVEIMLASINFNATTSLYQTADRWQTFRDLLDGGDTPEIFMARYTLHALRLVGEPSDLLTVVPIAGLNPSIEVDSEEAWLAAHHDAKPYEKRRPELVDWWRAVLSDPEQRASQVIAGRENCRAASDATSFAYKRDAAASINSDDAELMGLLPRWLNVERKLTLLVGYTTGEYTEAMKAAEQRWKSERDGLLARSRELRATSPEALRVKAIFALDWQPTADFEGWDDQSAQLVRSLIADVVGLPAIDTPARDLDAWRHANGVAHCLENEEEDEAAYKALVAEIEAEAARGPEALQLARAL